MPCRLDERIFNIQVTQRDTQTILSFVYFLTVHYHSHIPEKTADDIERLRCGYPSLVLGKSV